MTTIIQKIWISYLRTHMKHTLNTYLLWIALSTVVSATPLKAAELASPSETSGQASAAQKAATSWQHAPTQTINAGGVDFAYRELGKHNGGTPVVVLVHLAAVLDNWDPRVMDGLAAKHHVIAFDNRGIGSSTGSPSASIEDMADDAILFIQAMGLQQVDLLGFSLGGMVAQDIVLKKPELIRKMVLAGTGPAGGKGISSVAAVTFYDMFRGFITGQDPKQFLFFNRTPSGIEAGKAFLARLQERTNDRDKEISVSAFMAQLRSLYAWGNKTPSDLSVIKQPVLVVNGDEDRMVPTANTHDLARRLQNSQLIIYPNAAHGAIFQFHEAFVRSTLAFLAQ
jgi:pimeloyl-ACP methyl ester carboxylesterase